MVYLLSSDRHLCILPTQTSFPAVIQGVWQLRTWSVCVVMTNQPWGLRGGTEAGVQAPLCSGGGGLGGAPTLPSLGLCFPICATWGHPSAPHPSSSRRTAPLHTRSLDPALLMTTQEARSPLFCLMTCLSPPARAPRHSYSSLAGRSPRGWDPALALPISTVLLKRSFHPAAHPLRVPL